jgi:hypothetical protein
MPDMLLDKLDTLDIGYWILDTPNLDWSAKGHREVSNSVSNDHASYYEQFTQP